jgi:hypothetical protein
MQPIRPAAGPSLGTAHGATALLHPRGVAHVLERPQAKKTLGWATTSTLEQDLGWYYPPPPLSY